MSPYKAHIPVFDIETTLTTLADSLACIGDFVSCIDQCLTALESKPNPSTAKLPPSTAPAPKKAKGCKSKKETLVYQLGGHFGPNPTPSTGVLAPIHIRTSKLGNAITKAVQEKMALTLLVLDEQAGHVVGHARSGLKQIHDLSSTKVSVSPTVTAGFRTISIWGTDQEVGDAISAIGKWLAHCHLCTPKKKVKKEKAPSSEQPSSTAPPPIVVANVPHLFFFF